MYVWTVTYVKNTRYFINFWIIFCGLFNIFVLDLNNEMSKYNINFQINFLQTFLQAKCRELVDKNNIILKNLI